MRNYKILEIDGQKYYLVPVYEMNTRPADISLSDKLRRYRVENNLTIKELSDAIKIAVTQLARLEKGQRPNAKTQRKLESFLGEI